MSSHAEGPAAGEASQTPQEPSDAESQTEPVKSSTEEFTRATVESLKDKKVKCTDRDDNGLELFCYDSASIVDDTAIESECRGVVFHGDEIVMKAFPLTVQVSEEDKERIEQDILPVFDQCEFYDSYEGALVRMFYFADKWYCCTHRKLSAFKSKWADDKSFGDLLVEALEAESAENEKFRERLGTGERDDEDVPILERFQAGLNKGNQYMFLVLNNERNRIVCTPPSRPCVYHVGTFKDKELLMTEDTGLPYPVKHEFKCIEDLERHMETVSPEYLQGVIVFAPGNRQYKILNSTYHRLFGVRGNVASVPFRYLEVRMQPNMVGDLYSLYPGHAGKFDEYENALYDVAQELHKAYWGRFVTKQNKTKYPSEEYRVMQQCHAWHEQDRKRNLVDQEVVINVLNKQRPSALNAMLKRHLKGKQTTEKARMVVKTRIRSNTVRSECADAPNGPASPLLLSLPAANATEKPRVLSET
jgi:hypothetical protein